jgi:hypothetical protein
MRARMLCKIIGLFTFLLILSMFTSVPAFAQPPLIEKTWQLQDNMSTEGLYQVRTKITDDGGPGNVTAYLYASIGGGPFEPSLMQYNQYDYAWGWVGFIDPHTTLEPGTQVEYYIKAIDNTTHDVSLDPPEGAYAFQVQPPPLAWRIKKRIQSLCQFNFEQKYWVQKTVSWCAPTAAAACLRWLQIPGIPPRNYRLAKKLAWYMDTDCIRTGPPFCQPFGTAYGMEVKGIHRYLNKLGQRGNYTIKVWDDTRRPGYGTANKRYRRNPGFLDYKKELKACEDVLLVIRYTETKNCGQDIEDGGHIVTGMGWDKAGTSTSAVMDPLCGIKKQPVKWLQIVAGPNCIADTAASASTDDVQMITQGGVAPNPMAVVVGPGPNGTVETRPRGDDVVQLNYNGNINCVAGSMISISPVPAGPIE